MSDTYTIQINKSGIAITDSCDDGSVLMAGNVCFTYTMDHARLISMVNALETELLSAKPIVSRLNKRKDVKDGLYVIGSGNGLFAIYCDGEAAALQRGVLRHTRRFSTASVISHLNRIFSEVPQEPPTYEDILLRARYIADGDLVIINSELNCLVYSAESLNGNKISACLVDGVPYCDVTLQLNSDKETIDLLCCNDVVFSVRIDKSIHQYLLRGGE